MVDTISAAQARRIALAAQGFGRAEPPATAAAPGIRQLNALMRTVGLLQLDSVNVFERSHYLPHFARLGAYDKAELDRLTFAPRSGYVEYWAHEAAVIPVHDWPLWRWKMQRERTKARSDPDSWSNANAPMLEWLTAELAGKGPMPASAIEHDANRRSGPWWGWSDVKTGLETLFRWGELVSGGRDRFERQYALPTQRLSAAVLEREVGAHEAHTLLLERAARAHGIGTASDLADYYRLATADAAPALRELEEAGVIRRVAVEGWSRPAYLHRDARIPRRMDAAALLSPFDPVVWDRRRTERLFDFHYRIEIYTPAHKRVYGYYSLPVLVDGAIVGRIDLKNDRQNRVLRVQSAWREPTAPVGIEERIAPLLHAAARWQGLDAIEVMNRGGLARPLAAALGLTVLPAP